MTFISCIDSAWLTVSAQQMLGLISSAPFGSLAGTGQDF